MRASVLVVGAGPTGLVLANLLGRAGVSTLLVERNAETVSEPRAVSIDDESLRTLQTIGLADAMRQHLLWSTGYNYIAPSGRCFARIEPTTTEYGYPRRSNFHQPTLERILRQGLERFREVSVSFGHELESLRQDEDGVSARLVTPGGDAVEARADWLVACDGARSTVRTLVGIGMVGSTYEQQWLIVDTANDTDGYRHSRFFCNPRRPTVSVPGPGRTRRWEFMLRPGESAEEMLEPQAVRALLRPHRGDALAEIVRTAVYTFHARVAERWSERRIFVAGDAAHLTPPFAGQGMNIGIRDATNLAWKLAAVSRGAIGPRLLESYERERRDHAWRMILLAVRIGWVMMPTSAWRARLMTAVLGALSAVPSVRDWV
ncbi:MAG: bifunctional 3-(3-hydroxy-phenyl)propionate/3-hydroxycinnamic acid hydroxylase, partial [Candidatus Binatia bacterium]